MNNIKKDLFKRACILNLKCCTFKNHFYYWNLYLGMFMTFICERKEKLKCRPSDFFGNIYDSISVEY